MISIIVKTEKSIPLVIPEGVDLFLNIIAINRFISYRARSKEEYKVISPAVPDLLLYNAAMFFCK